MKVFVAGLSRSGKTSRSQYAAASLPDIHYVSVSQLLRSSGGQFPVETLAVGLVNQRLASDALGAISVTGAHQLIDGHALIETDEGPLVVPDWFFDELAPDLIIYVRDRPEEIVARRPPMMGRDHIGQIAALTLLEWAICERTAARLGISLIALEAPSLDGFVDELKLSLEKLSETS